MYAVVVRFQFRAPVRREVVERAEKDIIDPATQLPGFRAYYGVRLSDTEAIAVHVWDSEADAERGGSQMAALTQHVVGDLLAGPPQPVGGEVLIHRQR